MVLPFKKPQNLPEVFFFSSSSPSFHSCPTLLVSTEEQEWSLKNVNQIMSLSCWPDQSQVLEMAYTPGVNWPLAASLSLSLSASRSPSSSTAPALGLSLPNLPVSGFLPPGIWHILFPLPGLLPPDPRMTGPSHHLDLSSDITSSEWSSLMTPSHRAPPQLCIAFACPPGFCRAIKFYAHDDGNIFGNQS